MTFQMKESAITGMYEPFPRHKGAETGFLEIVSTETNYLIIWSSRSK